jgi:hypothetical protein
MLLALKPIKSMFQLQLGYACHLQALATHMYTHIQEVRTKTQNTSCLPSLLLAVDC